MQLNNADVVKKFIFRYLDLPLTNGSRNILVNMRKKDILNKFIELNKFLSASVSSATRLGRADSQRRKQCLHYSG